MGLESWAAVRSYDCPAGVVMPLSSVFGAEAHEVGAYVVIKDGVRANAVGELVFSAAPVVVSRETGTPRGSRLAFWQPFTMQRRVAGYASRDVAGEPLFDLEFTGSGMARLLVDTGSSAETFSFSSLD